MARFTYPPPQHIEVRHDQADIIGRAVKVKMVISRLSHGMGGSIEDVMEQYQLSQAQVYACLSYYYDHQAALVLILTPKNAKSPRIYPP